MLARHYPDDVACLVGKSQLLNLHLPLLSFGGADPKPLPKFYHSPQHSTQPSSNHTRVKSSLPLRLTLRRDYLPFEEKNPAANRARGGEVPLINNDFCEVPNFFFLLGKSVPQIPALMSWGDEN